MASGTGVPCAGLGAPRLARRISSQERGSPPQWWGSRGGLRSDAAPKSRFQSCGPEGRRGERRNQSAQRTPDLRGPLSVKAQLSAVETSSSYLVTYLRNTHVFQGYVAWLFLTRLLASRSNHHSSHLENVSSVFGLFSRLTPSSSVGLHKLRPQRRKARLGTSAQLAPGSPRPSGRHAGRGS